MVRTSKVKDTKIIALEIERELHREVLFRSYEKNLSIKDWVIQAILEKMKQEDQYNEDIKEVYKRL